MRAANNKNNGKKQSDILIGVALLLLYDLFVYISLPHANVSNHYVVMESETQLESPSCSDETIADKNAVTYSVSEASGINTERSSELSVTYPINLNTCTAQELMSVDGIGEARAAAIISYREQIGGYTSVEEIKNISGIGEVTFNDIAPYLTV